MRLLFKKIKKEIQKMFKKAIYLVVVFVAILAMVQASFAFDLLTDQTSTIDDSATTTVWAGGMAIVTCEGTIGGASVGIEYKPSGSSAYTRVYRDVGALTSTNGHMFMTDARPKSIVCYLPEACTVRGYLLNAGASTSVTLKIEE
jgi:hypothetical protein